VPAHLVQPRRGHHRAHPLRIDEHQPRVAHADVFVGRLHQLPAWRIARAGDMRGLEFLARAHVEEISRAFLILEPCLDAAGVP